jgi:hypothetical protein
LRCFKYSSSEIFGETGAGRGCGRGPGGGWTARTSIRPIVMWIACGEAVLSEFLARSGLDGAGEMRGIAAWAGATTCVNGIMPGGFSNFASVLPGAGRAAVAVCDVDASSPIAGTTRGSSGGG